MVSLMQDSQQPAALDCHRTTRMLAIACCMSFAWSQQGSLRTCKTHAAGYHKHPCPLVLLSVEAQQHTVLLAPWNGKLGVPALLADL